MEKLKEAFLEEYNSAKILKDMGRLRSAVILLSKAIFALSDHLILKKYGKLPKNHTERFRILEQKEPKIYEEADNVWSKYRDTYSKSTDEESFDMLNKAISNIIKYGEFEEEIKKTVE